MGIYARLQNTNLKRQMHPCCSIFNNQYLDTPKCWSVNELNKGNSPISLVLQASTRVKQVWHFLYFGFSCFHKVHHVYLHLNVPFKKPAFVYISSATDFFLNNALLMPHLEKESRFVCSWGWFYFFVRPPFLRQN